MRRLLGIAVSTLVLAACGGDDGDGDAAKALIDRAITATKESTSYRGRTDLTVAFPGERLEVSGRILSAMDESRSRLTAELSTDGASPPRIDQMVVEGRSFHRGETVRSALPPGKRWLEAETEAPPVLPLSELLEFLKHGRDPEVVGEEDVAGGGATHLRSPLDREELAEKTSSDFAEQIATPADSEVDAFIDVWISRADDRIRKLRFGLTKKGGTARASASIEILEYDAPLDAIKVPKAAVIATRADLQGG